MPSIEVRIAEPIAVPRAVVKLLIASINASLSVVGGTWQAGDAREDDETDLGLSVQGLDEGDGRLLGNGGRLGSTSVEHIDPETSIASMIVVELDGTGTLACGRAARH